MTALQLEPGATFLQQQRGRILLVSLVVCYAWLVYRTAWLSDDSFISLRTVANLLDGYGLRWNPDERVQTFTHPLWLLFLIGGHALTREPFYSTLYLSWAVSVLAVGYLILCARGPVAARALGLCLLCASKAFVDYSSSGLENPLTHLLLVLFALEYFASEHAAERVCRLCALAGLAALNRLDTAVLVLPALVPRLLRCAPRPRLRALCWFVLPLVGWELFSLVYYGFPFPNTAYAKLDVGDVIHIDRAREALRYFRASFVHDPLTLSTIAGCAAYAFTSKDRVRSWLLGGAIAYLGYVVSIGGDFMQGRFFSGPFLLAVACLCTSGWPARGRALVTVVLLALALGALGDPPPPFTSPDYGDDGSPPATVPESEDGVHEARREFFRAASLINAAHMNPARRDNPWSARGHALRERVAVDPSARLQVIDAIGFAAYYAGPKVHVVDRWALGDPLLARLPAMFGGFGHNQRSLPAGYLVGLARGTNAIEDPGLHRYYDALRSVVRDPLFSARRWRAIVALNTKQLDPLLTEYAYLSGRELRFAVRLVNPSDQPVVVSYVWNADRSSSYVVDFLSTRGHAYELQWTIAAGGARLSIPFAPVSRLEQLAKEGFFTLSFAFHRAPGDVVRDLYELRFYYRREGARIRMLRDPWPVSMLGFPGGIWHIDPDAVAPAVRLLSIASK